MIDAFEATRHAGRRARGVAACALAALATVAPLAVAGDLPELPSFEPPARERGTLLPPVGAARPATTRSLAQGARVRVERYRFTGNTVLSDRELEEIAAGYSGRDVAHADLAELRDALTRAYIDAGYLSSGAVIPDQTVRDGVVEIAIIEGSLAGVEIRTDGRLRSDYLATRLGVASGGTVNVFDLEARLEELQRDPRIESVDAQLVPTARRGRAELLVDVSEATPYQVSLDYDNHRPPPVGSEGGTLRLGHYNLTGRGDRIFASYEASKGYVGVEGSYEVPIGPFGTRLGVSAEASWADVVDKDFDDLHINSRYAGYAVRLSQPLYDSGRTRLEVALQGEHRRSKCFFLGIGCILPGLDDGVAKVTALRLSQELSYRGSARALGLSSQFSLGLDALRATDQPRRLPDGDFFHWQGRAYYAQRVPFLDATLFFRTEAQLSGDSLLSMEQLAIGGHDTVRGYRQNRLVRDNAVVGGVELRIPVLRREGLPWLELGPLFDIGWAWNHRNNSLGERRLRSAGVVARVRINDRTSLVASWAKDLKRVEVPGEHDDQDSGFHVRVVTSWFD